MGKKIITPDDVAKTVEPVAAEPAGVPIVGKQMKPPKQLVLSLVLVSKITGEPAHYYAVVVPYEKFVSIFNGGDQAKISAFLFSSIMQAYIQEKIQSGQLEVNVKSDEEIAKEIDSLYHVAMGMAVPADMVLVMEVSDEQGNGKQGNDAEGTEQEPEITKLN